MATHIGRDESLRAPSASAATGPDRASPYAYYALLLLVLANMFNYLDRYIVSILAPQIQKDLHLSDAQVGFLLGTAFAVLYGVLGIPMGRIADALSRKRLMAIGLTLWSMMTMLSAGARGFGGLSIARVGVGVGEAVASPVSSSLLCDYFPARNRAAVLGCYLASVHLGIGAALIVGGLLLQHWSSWCIAFPAGACQLPSWRAGFLLVGAPGLALAVLIAFMREPRVERPAGSVSAVRIIRRELSAALPPFTLISLHREAGYRAALANLIFAGLLAAFAAMLAVVTGDIAQWAAVAIGVYSVATWAQVLKHRDPPLFRLSFGCRTFMLSMFGGAFVTCFIGTIQVWAAPYAIRVLHAPPAKVGLSLGLASLGVAVASVVLGGFITDWWKRRDPRAPIWIGLIAVTVPVPLLFLLLRATSLSGFVTAFCLITFFSMSWAGSFAALVQDLVLPRMRATAAAIFSLVMVLTASGIGPYWTGKISTMTGSLTAGLYGLLVFVPIAVILLLLAARQLRTETPGQRIALAAAAGEA